VTEITGAVSAAAKAILYFGELFPEEVSTPQDCLRESLYVQKKAKKQI
jgi:hypothetical protein